MKINKKILISISSLLISLSIVFCIFFLSCESDIGSGGALNRTSSAPPVIFRIFTDNTSLSACTGTDICSPAGKVSVNLQYSAGASCDVVSGNSGYTPGDSVYYLKIITTGSTSSESEAGIYVDNTVDLSLYSSGYLKFAAKTIADNTDIRIRVKSHTGTEYPYNDFKIASTDLTNDGNWYEVTVKVSDLIGSSKVDLKNMLGIFLIATNKSVNCSFDYIRLELTN